MLVKTTTAYKIAQEDGRINRETKKVVISESKTCRDRKAASIIDFCLSTASSTANLIYLSDTDNSGNDENGASITPVLAASPPDQALSVLLQQGAFVRCAGNLRLKHADIGRRPAGSGKRD